jgi:hypothetical protein
MATKALEDLRQQALCAFQQELPQLMTEHAAQWVAYRGPERLGFAAHKHEMYQQCFQQGLDREEFVVFCIEPQETEISFGPVILD